MTTRKLYFHIAFILEFCYKTRMSKKTHRHITPIQLRGDNKTPLQLSLLPEYMDAVLTDCIELAEIRQDEARKQIIIQAGTRAVPIITRHRSSDEKTILDQRQLASVELLKVVKQALKYAKKSKLKVPDGGKFIDGINFKSIKAISKKANKDYGGDVSRVVDMVRCTILAGDIRDLQILSEMFRPCANPKILRYRNEFNRVNPEKGDIRRLQVNPVLESAGGHVGEILVFYGPSAVKYEESREAYGVKRMAEEAIDRSDGRSADQTAIVKASILAEKAERKRKLANREAASFPQIAKLRMGQQAFSINEFPVVVNDDAREGQRFALVPNPASGLWETDQRFLDIIDNPNDYDGYAVDPLSQFDASVRGHALCRSMELHDHLIVSP
jgi:hypothetical protein